MAAAQVLPGEGRPGDVLPETASVYWRRRTDERSLRLRGHAWTATTFAHAVPFSVTAGFLYALEPLSFPVGLALLAHAWVIPALYAQRGANVLRPRPKRGDASERTALGLLGDLIGHEARELHGRTGLVLERGRLGTWLVGEAGAVCVRPGGRRVDCWCVRVNDPALPSADRISHLLLALRSDEQGFATVANMTFSGAPWRVKRRMRDGMRPALDRAVAVAKER